MNGVTTRIAGIAIRDSEFATMQPVDEVVS